MPFARQWNGIVVEEPQLSFVPAHRRILSERSSLKALYISPFGRTNRKEANTYL
jgi:hypothetical protein